MIRENRLLPGTETIPKKNKRKLSVGKKKRCLVTSSGKVGEEGALREGPPEKVSRGGQAVTPQNAGEGFLVVQRASLKVGT